MSGSTYERSEWLILALYRGLLRREPIDVELAHWTNALMHDFPSSEIVAAFISSEEFRRASTAKLFVPPGHFYSPIVDPIEAERYFAVAEAKGVPNTLPGIVVDRAEMVRTWYALLPHLTRAAFPRTPSPGFRYAYENPAYSWGDGGILHAMLLKHRPKRVIEIGSGWSSACTIDTVEKYLDWQSELTFVDPYPQLLRELVGEMVRDVRIFECRIQIVPLEIFDDFERDDILFIDSTHILRTGSDVCFELFEILPRLASGVLVHIHDMFWPFEYPRAWAVNENRSWNELYAIRAFLTNNTDWRIVFFNDFFAKFEKEIIETTWPPFLRNSGGALWLRRC
ncbi:MAG: class I SAM-dependent methyltransferase [Methylocella sp.]